MSGTGAVSAWLGDVDPAIPGTLLQRMREAIEAADPATDRATRLGNAGLIAMHAALAAGDDRSAALDLLAADALLTHAAEAAAAEGEAALHAFTDRFGTQALRRAFLAETAG